MTPKSLSSKVLFLCGLLGGLWALDACSPMKKVEDKPKSGPSPVGYVVLSPTPLHLTTEISGRTQAYLNSEVRPQISGIIKAKLFTDGASVKAGQSLYQIDPGPSKASLSAAKALVSTAEANLNAAQTKAKRYAELIKIKAISQQEFDDQDTALKLAKAALETAKANLETATITQSYTEVRAPITGRVGLSSVTPGALVTANQAQILTTVQDISKIYVDMSQSAADRLRLQKAYSEGQLNPSKDLSVELVLDDGTVFDQKGRLEFSDMMVNPTTGTVTLRAVFDNPKSVVLPGMFVKARIKKGDVDQGLLIPQTAVGRNFKGEATVFIAGEDSKAHQVVVTLSDMIGSQWLVTSGLKAGDKVIVEGLMKLRPEAPIKAKPVKAATSGSKGA